MDSRYPYSHQISHNPTHRLRLEYDVLHHRNDGENRILTTEIGTFSTLQDAQHAAQDALGSTLDHYVANGWYGYYCNDITLELRGLITGMNSEQVYEYLSEFHIYAREKPYEPFSSQIVSIDKLKGLSTGCVQPCAQVSHNGCHDINTPAPSAPESFLQTLPPHPNHPGSFVPHSSAQQNQNTSFSTRSNDAPLTDSITNTNQSQEKSGANQSSNHKRSSRGPKKNHGDMSFVGNALGGGDDIGEPYLGRRYSLIDLSAGKKKFQFTIKVHP